MVPWKEINTSLLMLREWTYTASSRDALGNTSPSALDFPRASPSGNLSGLGVQNPRPWEISRASGDVFPNTSLLSAVYGYNNFESLLECICVEGILEVIQAQNAVN